MKKVEHKDLDKHAWDKCIRKSDNENIFMYSWYLDAVAPGWEGLIQDDYSGVFPLTTKTQLGKSSLFQPIFTREFEPFGTLPLKVVLEYLDSEFNHALFRTSIQIEQSEKRVHQIIELEKEFKLKTNAKRILKKSVTLFEIREANDPKELIKLFQDTAYTKIDSLGSQELERLETLMNTALKNDAGKLKYIYKKNKCVGGAFFLLDKSRITLLKSACLDEAKREGAMYQLINQTIQESKENYKTFDFGGSNVSAVREFYLKFGATDREYFEITIGKEPGWKKKAKSLLKRVKKK
ncbi:MAG: hypothetical protein MK078_01520 [Crocinitomicaceae bacterium]|nr:hypothetical protein [Crocinitomicaceae bacterium]